MVEKAKSYGTSFPETEGPKPRISPSRFAEILVNGYGLSSYHRLLEDIEKQRLTLSDSSHLDRAYGVWFDDLTICIETILERNGVQMVRKLSENRLVPPESYQGDVPFEDLAF